MGIDELLGVLSPGVIMAFLILFSSMYLILQVAKTDANYSVRVKKILLSIAWFGFVGSFLVVLTLLFLALLPILDINPDILPTATIDFSLVIFWGISFVLWMLFYLAIRFTINKLEPWLPKSRAEKKREKAVESIDKSIELLDKATNNFMRRY